MNLLILMVMSGLVLSAGGCNQKDVIPERLEGKVDRDLRYADIKTNPESHKGKLMLAGGKVLSAKRTQAGTRIEVLQIPLSDDLIPTGRDTESKGRFVVIDSGGEQVSDPAVFDGENKRVTVVGEVLGKTTIKIDEVEQQVPQLAMKHTQYGIGIACRPDTVRSTATDTPMHGDTVGTMGIPIIGRSAQCHTLCTSAEATYVTFSLHDNYQRGGYDNEGSIQHHNRKCFIGIDRLSDSGDGRFG